MQDWAILFIYIFYMIINLITDSKKLETYNRLHLTAFIFALVILFTKGHLFIEVLIVIAISLGIGLLLERTPIMKIGSGDTKMMVVSSIYLLILTPIKPMFIPILLFVCYKIIISIIVGTFSIGYLLYSKNITNNSKQEIIEIGNYKIRIRRDNFLPNIAYQIPATGGILSATILLIFIF